MCLASDTFDATKSARPNKRVRAHDNCMTIGTPFCSAPFPSMPTIPSTIGIERETNPFLRSSSKELRNALAMNNADDIAVFAETRRRKDVF